MKFKPLLLLITAGALLLVGCESKAGTGALAGGALGAGTGALIGGAPGAAIGAGAGAVGGAIIGSTLDASDRKNMERQSPSTINRVDRGQQLTVDDIIQLHRGGIEDEKIINLIRNSDSRYMLNTRQIDQLRNAGVSNRVINYMMQT